jgi:hypothetical protein
VTGIAAFETALAAQGLGLAGHLPVIDSDPVPEGCHSIALISPDEPGFWQVARSAPELSDGAPDPLDRLSKRLIRPIADAFGGTAIFPSDGPPYAPFVGWALRSQKAWSAPMGMLVGKHAGLWVSFRGAVALPWSVSPPVERPSPCSKCPPQPCLSTCPVDAWSAETGYDLDACHAFLDTEAGEDCMINGCAARRACPISQRVTRLPEQSEFHMRAFHP